MFFLKEWLTKNIYVTSPFNPDPFFHPRRLQVPKAAVIQISLALIRQLPRWKLEQYYELQGRIHAIRQSRVLGFVDDINIYIGQGIDGITTLEMTSQSRIGKGDWGQNRRNLKKFLSRFDFQVIVSASSG